MKIISAEKKGNKKQQDFEGIKKKIVELTE